MLTVHSKTLPAKLVVDERKLLGWTKMFLSANVVLRPVSCTAGLRTRGLGSAAP